MQINHDPFEYFDMQRKARFSNSSSGSRRSIPSIKRNPSFQEAQFTRELFPLGMPANTLNMPLFLKEEKPYEDIFEEDNFDRSTDCQFLSSCYSATHMESSNNYEMSNECSVNIDDMVGSNENSLNFNKTVSAVQEVEPVPVEAVKPVISREGIRQAHKTSSVTAGSKAPRRCKKSDSQVAYLNELYTRLGGKWDGKCRKEAMAKTGLSRIQIYKWFFDRQLQEKAKTQKSKQTGHAHSDASEDLSTSENGDSQSLFTVEKVNF